VLRAERNKLVQEWARLLGWPELTLIEYPLPKRCRKALGFKIVCYYRWESEETDIRFQVNMMPVWHACVYAIRYRICTGWHVFRLYRHPGWLRREAERLDEFLRADWFLTLEGRRLFRARDPECADISWKRIRSEGFPCNVGARP